MVREIVAQKPLDYYRGPEFMPGASVKTDDEIDAWIRQYAETIYHPVGSCRMGVDAKAVVDPQLRVRGVDGLRVADVSIMPMLVSGNTNAPAMMIGERVARFVLGTV